MRFLVSVLIALVVLVVVHAQFPTTPTPTESTIPSRPAFPTAETYFGNRRCWVGTRTFTENGTLYEDSAFPALCREEQNYCAYFNYDLTTLDQATGRVVTYRSQTGYCVSDPAEVDCSIFRSYVSPFGQLNNCEARVCRNSTDSYACNEFQGEAGRCSDTNPLSTLQIFPSCGVQETVAGTFQCLNILFTGYPFSNPGNCRNAWDRTMDCMARLATRCLSGNCPTVLDNLPGVRSEYAEVVLNTVFVNDVTSFSDRLKSYVNFDFEAMVVPLACSNDPASVLQGFAMLQPQLAALNLEQLLLDLGVPTDFCPGFINRLQTAFFQFVPAVLGATGTNDVTSAFATFQQQALEGLGECNAFAYLGQLPQILGGFSIDVGLNAIVNAFTTITTLANTLPFPSPFPMPMPTPGQDPRACPAEVPRRNGFGHVNLTCERYYRDPTQCGQRQAWFCDYSSWRLNFLRSWRAEYARSSRNASQLGQMMPECREEDDVRCAKSQRCCYPTYDGCRVCFCQDHDYLEPDFLEGRWGADSESWDRFFNVYQQHLRRQQESHSHDDDEDDDDNEDEDTC